MIDGNNWQMAKEKGHRISALFLILIVVELSPLQPLPKRRSEDGRCIMIEGRRRQRRSPSMPSVALLVAAVIHVAHASMASRITPEKTPFHNNTIISSFTTLLDKFEARGPTLRTHSYILEIKLTAYADVTYYIRETSFSYVCKQKTISC